MSTPEQRLLIICNATSLFRCIAAAAAAAVDSPEHVLDGGVYVAISATVFRVEQLRKVRSTVHLTGTPDGEIKEALQSLLDPSAPTLSRRETETRATIEVTFF